MATFAELLATKTKEQWYDELVAGLPASLQVTSWRDGDVARTLLEIDAQALSEEALVRSQIAAGGLLDSALEAGLSDWITLVAKQLYGLDRNPASYAVRTVLLTASAGAGPYTITPGQLWFAATNGLRYNASNPATVTLGLAGTLSLPVLAETAGAAYNSAPVTSMVTPLAGVTVSDTALATPGVDEETDVALVTRCEGRWSALGTGSPAAAYDTWARTASASVTRTRVSASSSVAGQADILIAGPAGGVASDVVAAVQAYIDVRAPLCSIPVVASATNSVLAITATLYGKAQYQTAAVAGATAALQALIANCPIGSTLYGAAKIEALMAQLGVENAIISTGSGDTALSATQVVTAGTINVNWSNT
jgi:hypothetical protein